MREYGSEHPAVLLPDEYFKSLESLGRNIMYLRSGREALLLAALSISDKKEKIILFPSYCCWSMSAPFEKSGWNLIYYRLNEDLTVDIDYLAHLLNTVDADAILTMNFYGSACTDNAVLLAKAKNIKVIEDFSHCTFSLKKIFNPNIDVYVSSIRKSIGVCDGAILLSKKVMNNDFIQKEQSEFCERRYIAQTEKERYAFSKDAEKKNYFLSELRECECILNEFTAVRPISRKSMQMISLINGKEIAYARRENMRHLINLLVGKVRILHGVERSLDGAPFSLPIIVENRDEVQRKLAQLGVYAPVLWPICKEAAQICEVSKMMGEQMLSIPIDQRYDWDDMEDIAAKIIRICC